MSYCVNSLDDDGTVHSSHAQQQQRSQHTVVSASRSDSVTPTTTRTRRSSAVLPQLRLPGQTPLDRPVTVPLQARGLDPLLDRGNGVSRDGPKHLTLPDSLGLHVLFVDDEVVNRNVAKRMLQRVGCTAVELSDGDEVEAALVAAGMLVDTPNGRVINKNRYGARVRCGGSG